MIFKFEIDVEVDRTDGKFASREEIADVIVGWLESADEGTIYGIGADGSSSYEINSWSVSEIEAKR